MSKGFIVFFDEDEQQRNLLSPRLEFAFGEEFEIRTLEPFGTVGETVRYLLEQGDDLCALVTDERMHETGVADFRGSALASEYRLYNPYIPIYVLTSHVTDEDLQDSFGDYDYVISKSDLREIDKIPVKLIEVLARNVGRYITASSERAKRMHELIELSLVADLKDAEAKELENLLNWSRTTTRIIENSMQIDIKKSLEESEEVLCRIRGKLGDLASEE